MSQMMQVANLEENAVAQPIPIPNSADTYLIFSVHDERWAINTMLVQEIMHSAKIHPLPFVPPYIEGVVNCRGLPYTVINTLKLDRDESEWREIERGTVLVFKRSDDHFALHISNIEVFFEPEEEEVKSDGIRYKKNLIRFFDADYIESALRRDLCDEEFKNEEGLI